MKDLKTAFEFTLPQREFPGFQSFSDTTLYFCIFQDFFKKPKVF